MGRKGKIKAEGAFVVAAVRMQWRELRERRRKPLTELRNQSLDREAVSAPNFIIVIYI